MTDKQESQLRIVNIDSDGQVTSRRHHLFADCSMLNTDEETTNLSAREAYLTGLTQCKVCAKRAEGGPALQALIGVLADTQVYMSAGSGSDSDDKLLQTEPAARLILDELRKRGFYLASRQPKEQS